MAHTTWSTPAVLLALACVVSAHQRPVADMVLLGGKIISVDAEERVYPAMAIAKERILALGSDAAMKQHIGPQTRVIELAGRAVIPGIVQSHSHAIGAARHSLWQTHVELTSISQIQDWIRRRAAEIPAGRWIQVPRADITRLEERRHPTPAELDAACSTHPVAFNAARKWVLNTVGFEVSGVLSEASKDASRIRVLRDDAGRARMLVGADGFLRPLLPAAQLGPPDRQQHLAALEGLLQRYNSVGITSIFERASNREGFDTYELLRDDGRLSVRVTLTMRATMRTAADVERFIARLELQPRQGDRWVKAGPLKITVDGGIHWGNTFLREAYGSRRTGFYALDDPSYRGDIRYTTAQMADVFAAGHRLGWQMCCHVTGDAGVDRVLDALQRASKSAPVRDRRFTLVHAYFPALDSIQRAQRLGVCVDTQVDLYYKDSDAIAEVYGRDWANRFIGVGDWVRGKIPLAINGDHMIGFDPDRAMNSFNPFLHLYVAVSRKNNRGRVYGVRQKVSRLEALRSMTASAAYLSFDEDQLGSLEAGKLADLVVLDRDYLTCPEGEIRKIRVVLTAVDGKVVYAQPPFDLALRNSTGRLR